MLDKLPSELDHNLFQFTLRRAFCIAGFAFSVFVSVASVLSVLNPILTIFENYNFLQIASAISRVPTAVGSLRSSFRS